MIQVITYNISLIKKQNNVNVNCLDKKARHRAEKK